MFDFCESRYLQQGNPWGKWPQLPCEPGFVDDVSCSCPKSAWILQKFRGALSWDCGFLRIFPSTQCKDVKFIIFKAEHKLQTCAACVTCFVANTKPNLRDHMAKFKGHWVSCNVMQCYTLTPSASYNSWKKVVSPSGLRVKRPQFLHKEFKTNSYRFKLLQANMKNQKKKDSSGENWRNFHGISTFLAPNSWRRCATAGMGSGSCPHGSSTWGFVGFFLNPRFMPIGKHWKKPC